jgi:hypothetical protein
MARRLAHLPIHVLVLLYAPAALCDSSSSSSSSGGGDGGYTEGRGLHRGWLAPRLPPGDRALALLQAMNLSEKVAMLHGHPEPNCTYSVLF